MRLRFQRADVAGVTERPDSSPPAIAACRILVIDDDPLITRSLRASLERDGHTVVTAGGGEEGIAAFEDAQRAEPFDIVITDLGMPRIDGRRVASAVKATHPAPPVILLTGWGQRFVASEKPPHVDRVLNKPPKLQELRTALRDLIVRSESEASGD